MIAAFIFLAALFPVERWELKPPFETNRLIVMSLAMEQKAQQTGGEKWALTQTQELVIKSADAKGYKGLVLIKDVVIEGEDEGDGGDDFAVALNRNGRLVSTTSFAGEKMRLTMMPTFFVYPSEPVALGDKWTAQDDSPEKGKINLDYEAKAEERLDGLNVVRIDFSFAESGKKKKAPFNGGGAFWVGKDGIVRKFVIKESNAPVPWDDSLYELKISGVYVANPK